MSKSRLQAKAPAYSKWTGYRGQNTLYHIAGLSHRSNAVQDAFRQKSENTLILLKREPDNQYDPNAVALYAALTLPGQISYEWHKIGYVEKGYMNQEFKDLPTDHVLEATKRGTYGFSLNGQVRKYI